MPPKNEVKSFSEIWPMVAEIGESERHFNLLQARYRQLASTWLLAAFAALGFILTKTFSPEMNKFLLCSAISWAGAIGISLIWILDVLVYHRLLNAHFTEGYKLEQLYSWLPQVRHKMITAQGNKGVRSRTIWFYVISISLLLLVGWVALTYFITGFASMSAWWLMSIGLAVTFLIGFIIWKKTLDQDTLISN